MDPLLLVRILYGQARYLGQSQVKDGTFQKLDDVGGGDFGGGRGGRRVCKTVDALFEMEVTLAESYTTGWRELRKSDAGSYYEYKNINRIYEMKICSESYLQPAYQFFQHNGMV